MHIACPHFTDTTSEAVSLIEWHLNVLELATVSPYLPGRHPGLLPFRRSGCWVQMFHLVNVLGEVGLVHKWLPLGSHRAENSHVFESANRASINILTVSEKRFKPYCKTHLHFSLVLVSEFLGCFLNLWLLWLFLWGTGPLPWSFTRNGNAEYLDLAVLWCVEARRVDSMLIEAHCPAWVCFRA